MQSRANQHVHVNVSSKMSQKVILKIIACILYFHNTVLKQNCAAQPVQS